MIHKVKNVKLITSEREIIGDLEMYLTTEENGFYLNLYVKDYGGYTVCFNLFNFSKLDRIDMVHCRRDYFIFESAGGLVLSIRKNLIKIYKDNEVVKIALNRVLYGEEFRNGFTKMFENCLHYRYKHSEFELSELKKQAKEIGELVLSSVEYEF